MKQNFEIYPLKLRFKFLKPMLLYPLLIMLLLLLPIIAIVTFLFKGHEMILQISQTFMILFGVRFTFKMAAPYLYLHSQITKLSAEDPVAAQEIINALDFNNLTTSVIDYLENQATIETPEEL